MTRSHPIRVKLLSLLMAVVLPFCCCSLRIALGGEGSGPTQSKVMKASCCSQCCDAPSGGDESKAPDSPQTPKDTCPSKLCCLKGGPIIAPFHVPVDAIGAVAAFPAIVDAPAILSAPLATAPRSQWPPGPPPTPLLQHTLLLV